MATPVQQIAANLVAAPIVEAAAGESLFDSAAKTLSKHPAIWLQMGGLLYKHLTTRKALSNHDSKILKQDLRRHALMVSLYKSKLGVTKSPVEWELDEGNCPKYHASLASSAEGFKTECDKLRASHFPMKTTAIKMISSIQRLYESLNKRSKLVRPQFKYREDGFEAMFFSELAQWLAVDLPRYSITEQETADLVQKRIDYCIAVEKEVFLFRDDGNKNNPKKRLRRIVDNLTILKDDLDKSIKTASFNNYIESINANLKDMLVSAFDILYLVIREANQIELQVDELLHPRPEDKKVAIFLQTLMAQWIKSTLEMAKIDANNCESNEQILLSGIDAHLTTDFSDFDIKGLGVRKFARKISEKRSERDAYVIKLLQEVIEIHRAILNLCFVRSNLVLACRVGVGDGENWLYGTKGGQAMVESLLGVINDGRERLQRAVNVFWDDFYKKGYEPYAIHHNKDTTSRTYVFIETASKRVEFLNKKSEQATKTITKVIGCAKDYEGKAETVKQQKRLLASNLRDYVQLRRLSGVSPAHLSLLEEMSEADRRVPELRVERHVTFISEKIEPYIVRFPKTKMPLYQEARRGLLDDKAVSARDLSWMRKPPRFYTPTQELLYNKFLDVYKDAVTSHTIFARYYGVDWSIIGSLRELYSRINVMMKAIYAPRTIAGYSLCLMSPGILLEEKKLYLTIEKDGVKYGVKNGAEVSMGSILMKDIDAEWDKDKPITLELLQTYFLRILRITSKRDHTTILPEVMPADTRTDIFYRLRKKDTETLEFLWDTELQLIDQIFKRCLLRFSQTCQEKTFNVLGTLDDANVLQVGFKGEDIEISIDPRLLAYAGGAFAVALENITRDLEREKVAHAALRERYDALTVEKGLILAERDSTLRELGRKNELIAQLMAVADGTPVLAEPEALGGVARNRHALFAAGGHEVVAETPAAAVRMTPA